MMNVECFLARAEALNYSDLYRTSTGLRGRFKYIQQWRHDMTFNDYDRAVILLARTNSGARIAQNTARGMGSGDETESLATWNWRWGLGGAMIQIASCMLWATNYGGVLIHCYY